MNMRILVTGGSGFIGTNLCKKLLLQNNEVICLDNLSCSSENNITDLINNKNFTFIKHNIQEYINIDGKIDQIYHLACPASPKNYQIYPIETIKTCINGTFNILKLAKQKNASVLLSSTSEIYGDPTISPQVEEYWGNVNTIGIRSCYDESKRLAETIMIEYNRKYNIDIKIARIFNTYGPYLAKNDGRVVSNFILQALKNEDITIYGDGKQTRSFCFIDDQVDGLIKLMNSKYNLPINIGNPYEITILQLAETILKITNSNSKIIFKDLPSDDPKQRKPDITKAKTILNWIPKISLENGLKATIKYFS